MGGLTASISSSKRICSSAVSVNLAVETVCCASTARQQVPFATTASDDSAPGVQVLNDISEAGYRLNKVDRLSAQGGVFIGEPSRSNFLVAARHGVQRSVQTNEQYGQLERLLVWFERVFALLHAGDGGFRSADDAGEMLAFDA